MMNCSIPGTNLKAFGKAVHNLAKFGDEIYLEACDAGLSLQVVNSTRSAYGCFNFAPRFFQHYDWGSAGESCSKCKIGMKSCLNAFKSLGSIEKSVDHCDVSMCSQNSRLVFQLHCKHGMLKTYNMPYLELEDLKAAFSRSQQAHTIVSASRTLCDVVANFQSNQEEVTFVASPEKLVAKTYLDDDVETSKALYTEMTLGPEEFESYQVSEATEVTFCLKELRAILAFAESLSLLVEIQFESAGKPILISVKSEPLYEGSFVLATLADVAASQEQHAKLPSQTTSASPMTATVASERMKAPAGSKEVAQPALPSQQQPVHDVAYSLLMSPEPSFSLADDECGDAPATDTHPSKGTAAVEDDTVISTPPKKKFRSYFLGLSQQSTSFHASQYPVLAEDTDEENELH